MSAIYQRARPVRWEDIVGQEHVKDVLKGALEQGKLGHAYLFSGPRGVGKTTTARLIAMTANCTQAVKKPCGECESCLSVRAGSHPDVLEIDAASSNSVDDIRSLREKVSLAAMRGGKKIYILDEAHMMTKAAFNAFLKTLEEPPPHVIFILATTEPEKIIPTILSRCQHYRFRRLTSEEIAGKLSDIAKKEGANAEPAALRLIGRLADGAMRDGESLLERMLAASSTITLSGIEDALGLPPSERVRSIAAAMLVGDAAKAIGESAKLYRDGFAARTIVEGLIASFGVALHAELGISSEGKLEHAEIPKLLRLQAALDQQESRFGRSADQQSLELALVHALLATENTPASSNAGLGGTSEDTLRRISSLEKDISLFKSGAMARMPSSVPDFEPSRRGAPAQPPASSVRANPEEKPKKSGNWADVMSQAGPQLKAFLRPAAMHAEDGYASLSYDSKGVFHAKQVILQFDVISEIVLKVFGSVTLEIIAPDGIGRKQKLGIPEVPKQPEAPKQVVAAETGKSSLKIQEQISVPENILPPPSPVKPEAVEAVSPVPDLERYADPESSITDLASYEAGFDDSPFESLKEENKEENLVKDSIKNKGDGELVAKSVDITSHKMYKEVISKFSGRVREIGRNRSYQPTAQPEGALDDGSSDY